MKKITLLILLLSYSVFAQKKNPVYDDFGGQSTINWWSFPSGESEYYENKPDPKNRNNHVSIFFKNKIGNTETHHGIGANFPETFNLKNKSKEKIGLLSISIFISQSDCLSLFVCFVHLLCHIMYFIGLFAFSGTVLCYLLCSLLFVLFHFFFSFLCICLLVDLF